MMEIKFRVWDNEFKVFGYPARGEETNENDKTFGLHDRYIIFQIGDRYDALGIDKKSIEEILADRDRFVIMQYIGMKDKNGREIYEGDILLFSNGYKDSEYKDVVIFKNGCFICKNTHKILSFDDGGTTFYPEVIGNIYENPELLND